MTIRRSAAGIRLVAACALAVLLTLSGCGRQADTPLEMVQKELGVPVQVAAQEPVPGGSVILYRYARNGRCGVGYIYVRNGRLGGGGGRGEGDCNRVLGVGAGAQRDPNDPLGNLAVTYGEVNDPRIASVQVTFQDGSRFNARVSHGVWYALFPGQSSAPRVRSVAGFDAGGAQVHQAP